MNRELLIAIERARNVNPEPLTTHNSPLTPLHIGLVISTTLQQMIEGGGQLGRVRLILGIEPAEGKTDRQPRHQTMLRQWGDHLTGWFVNEVQAGAGRAHRAMIMPGHVGAEWQVS